MGRTPCCDKLGLKKGPWTPEEDQKLLAYIDEQGHGNWRALPTKAGLQRCGKSCRLRWTNYLRPDIKRGKFSLQEEQTIIQLHALLGNRWSAIATHLPKRTDNEIKNYWNTHLKKRLAKMGIDPVTHKPKNDALMSTADNHLSKNATNLSHMAQWESARLEAEARLVRQSKLRSNSNTFLSPSSSPPPSTSHHIDMTANFGTSSNTTTNSGNISSSSNTIPRCLDVLKAWHNVWPNNANTNDQTTSIGVGIIGSQMGGLRVGIESPTSTLSFSENGPPLLHHQQFTSAGSVIEFMGHSGDNIATNNGIDLRSPRDQEEDQELIKDEGDQQEWKNTYHHQNEHGLENSLSLISDDQDHQEHDQNEQSFMEGFTELLLRTAATSGNGKSLCNDGENERKCHTNNDGSRGGSSSSGSDHYYEDNKNYWNSILHLVNSSPSHSPMF